MSNQVDTRREYRETEQRPELPPGYAWQQLIVETPNRDVREFKTRWRAVRLLTPDLRAAQDRMRDLFGSPWEKSQQQDGPIPATVKGEIYSTNPGTGAYRKVVLTPEGKVYLETLQHGEHVHYEIAADPDEIRALYAVVRPSLKPEVVR